MVGHMKQTFDTFVILFGPHLQSSYHAFPTTLQYEKHAREYNGYASAAETHCHDTMPHLYYKYQGIVYRHFHKNITTYLW